jgi:hypothetical protein
MTSLPSYQQYLPEIREWHFHVYWFQTDNEQTRMAKALREQLVQAVRERQFIVVCTGVTDSMVGNVGLREDSIPPMNNVPRGPHPVGSRA